MSGSQMSRAEARNAERKAKYVRLVERGSLERQGIRVSYWLRNPRPTTISTLKRASRILSSAAAVSIYVEPVLKSK